MSRLGNALRPALVPILAVITAFIVGSIFILITDFENLSKIGTDPVGAITGALGLIVQAYYAMLIGAISGALLVLQVSNVAALGLAAVLLAIVVVGAGAGGRGSAAWHAPRP